MEKLKEKREYLEAQLNEYNNYVKACLEQSVIKYNLFFCFFH